MTRGGTDGAFCPRGAAIFITYVCPAFAEDKAPSRPVPRTELVPLTSLTIADEQFLKGDANGKAATIAAEFRLARPSGPQPVVVLMHGSGGIGSNISAWVDELNGLGISTFVIDGFTGRGLQGTGANQALLGRLNFILDIYRALEVSQSIRVDTQRLALMGFSRGGQAALYASLKRFHQLWNKSGLDFAAYLPLPRLRDHLPRGHRPFVQPGARLWRRSRRLQPTRKVQSIC